MRSRSWREDERGEVEKARIKLGLSGDASGAADARMTDSVAAVRFKAIALTKFGMRGKFFLEAGDF